MDEPIRIMCVDDNELVRGALERKFTTTEGFAWCGSRPDATDLVQHARDWRADVILLDLQMPGPDAFAAMKLLARALPWARVVVLSGSVSPDQLDRALAAGASGYLCKSDENAAMVEVAQQVAEGRIAIGPEVRMVCGPLSAAQRQACRLVAPLTSHQDAPRDGAAVGLVPGRWSRVASMFRPRVTGDVAPRHEEVHS